MAFSYKNRTIAVGMRTWKTILSITICLFISRFIFNWGNPTVIILAAIFTLQNSTTDSVENTKIRILGSILGALIAAVGILIYAQFDYSLLTEFIVIPFGILCIIVLSMLFDYQRGIIIAIATFLTIVLQDGPSESIIYALYRIVDTSVGCLVSLLVNRFIFPYKLDTQ